MISAHLRPVAELTESEIAAWRELADSALEPNPFWDPDFVLPAAQELRPRDLRILVAEEGDEWICCLPVTRARGWHRLPLKGLVAWNHLYCYLGTPLLRTDAGEEALPRLLEEGRGHGGSFLGLDLVGMDGPFGTRLARAQEEAGLRQVELASFERATLERRPEQTYMALSGKHRRNFERLRRRLEDAVGAGLELRDRSDDPAAWKAFLEVEASGWKGGEGTGTALAAIGHGDLFLDICRRLSARGMLQLISAEAGDRTAAMLCNLVSGGTVFTFKIASAADLLEYSPGVQIEILYLDHFHADTRLERADSCSVPGNAMINRLWPDRRKFGVQAISSRGPLAVPAKPILQGAAWVGRKVAGEI